MIGFSIYSKTHLNNFVNSGLLKELSAQFDLEVIDACVIESKAGIDERKYKNWPQLPKILISVSNFIQLVNLWKHREVSMAHYVRAISTFGNKTERQKWKCVVFSNMEISWPRRLLVKIFASNITNCLVVFLEKFLREVFVLKAYRKMLQDIKVLVIPFSGHLAHEFGTQIWAARRLNIPTIALQENWDNLSSKTIIVDEPDYFLVWGNQSASHVRSVHKLTQCEVIVNGSPRFDEYFKTNLHEPVVISPNGEKTLVASPFILIAGTGDGLDDLALLETLHLAISTTNHFSAVVYRPHPLTRSIQDFDYLTKTFPKLLIDSHPDARKFNHHVGLIQNCEFLINHFSTLTLEALIAKRRVCVPLFLGRQASRYGYDRILSEWLHLTGINQMPGIEFPRNQNELTSSVRKLLNTSENACSRTDWYCKPGRYAEGLIQVLNVALKKSKNENC